MAEIEYTFKNGSQHVIPDTNRENFERMFDKDIQSQRIVGQEKPQVYTSKTASPPIKTIEKEIVSFTLEETKAEIKEEVAFIETSSPLPDEVIIIEEIN
jgi:hypothetical protein